MVFKVQDGIEFASRQEWRDYMMKTYYSFHDIVGGQHIKPPGSIEGQGFDIINCEGAVLVVMDSTEQIQIDNCKDCRLFLGASASTIFVRNCENCVIYAACKQLRIRECTQSDFYSYSKGEIHIELSNKLRFGPFNGGYAEQAQHLKSSGLLPVQNMWYEIYDHNADDEQPAHWRLLKEYEYESAWFPSAPCEVAIPLSGPPTASAKTQSGGKGQVGESFSLQQMKADAEKAAAVSREGERGDGQTSPSARRADGVPAVDDKQVLLQNTVLENDQKINQLGIETALLVASARAKGIDVSVWLSENAEHPLTTVPDFNSRFISLGLAVGIQEDWETKRELDLATSAASLATVLDVCGAGFDDQGVPLLNVHSFLCLCEEAVDRFLRNASTPASSNSGGSSDDKLLSSSEESSPVIGGDLLGSSTITTLLTAKPEGALEPEGEAVQPPPSPPPPLNVCDETSPPLKAKPSPGPEPRIDGRGRSMGSTPHKSRALSAPAARSTGRPRGSGVVTSDIQKFYIDSSDSPHYNPLTAVENLISHTVKQTDLYHKIQVHLGYLEAYTMTPARGKVVVSNPREWVTAQEVKEAFCAARLHLTMPQIALLLNLIRDFATQSGETGPSVRVSVSDKKEMKSLNSALIASAVILNHRVHADWLRKYLVHLRVGERARPWVAWVDKKIKGNVTRKRSEDDVMSEFRKALGGLSHDLNDEEVTAMVKKFDILPSEQLDSIIKNKVNAWIMDVDGRRDFYHLRNVRWKKWIKENKEYASLRGQEARKRKEKEVLVAIRKELIANKIAWYTLDEKKNASITREVFVAYVEDNRKKEFSFCPKFGEWLDQYVRDERKAIKDFSADASVRNREFNVKLSKSAWLAPRNLMEYAINEAIKNSPGHMQVELTSKAMGLKKHVRNDIRATSDDRVHPLVSRKVFERFFDDSFYDKMEKTVLQQVFFANRAAAEEAYETFATSQEELNAEKYKKWIEDKLDRKRVEDMLRVSSAKLSGENNNIWCWLGSAKYHRRS